MTSIYKEQVKLLLRVLPLISEEPCFALHGGTAINLFIRDMPRLSVDIDLTYVLMEDRNSSLLNIGAALERIKAHIEERLKAKVVHQTEVSKLLVSKERSSIKLEVNQINRGTLGEVEERQLCLKAQEEFETFCAVPVVPLGQLYGGKLCAALDRQHPRDLFDVRYLLENEGFTEEIKRGLLLCLLSSSRPIHELVSPHLQDQSHVLKKQFAGMSSETFSYEAFEQVRQSMIDTIHNALTDRDKSFLLSVHDTNPDWEIYDFSRFPAVEWKLANLRELKDRNAQKHAQQAQTLRQKLGLN
jgi:predicted nucleotidyltransferase component of viral defense system